MIAAMIQMFVIMGVKLIQVEKMIINDTKKFIEQDCLWVLCLMPESSIFPKKK